MLHLLYPFLYHLWFSDVFKGYRNETLDKNGLSVNFYFKNSIKFIKKKFSTAQAKTFFHYAHFRKQEYIFFLAKEGEQFLNFRRYRRSSSLLETSTSVFCIFLSIDFRDTIFLVLNSGLLHCVKIV